MKIKLILGYIWAILTIPLALMILMSSGALQNIIYGEDGLKVSDRITGGDVVQDIYRDDYSIQIHKQVFDGFFFERKTGFVQIDFITKQDLPVQINEEIDYNNDELIDFLISLNTQSNEYELIPKTKKVGSLTEEEVMVLENRRIIRVKITK